MENSKKSSGGMSLAGVLLVVFIVLKLCDVIAWSWVWVLSPLWIPIAIAFPIFMLAAVTRSWGTKGKRF